MFKLGQILAALVIILLLLFIGFILNEFWEALRAPILGFGLFYGLYFIYRKLDAPNGKGRTKTSYHV